MNALYTFDFAILDFINEHLVFEILDPVFAFITFLGDAGWFWIALSVLLIFFKKTRKIGISMAISLVFSLLVTNLTLKPLVNRPRPYALREVDLRVDPPHDASFPSGHTSASFAAAFALFWEDKKRGIPALVLASLIAFSRLYFYLHFFTDVLGGGVVGIAASIAAHFLAPIVTKWIDRLLSRFQKA